MIDGQKYFWRKKFFAQKSLAAKYKGNTKDWRPNKIPEYLIKPVENT